MRMSTLTARGAATRQRIVEAAAAHVREHGVAGTSIDDVMRDTATSKGQVFHYFPGGKADLLLAVARHEADRVLSEQQPHLDVLDSWDSWYAWRDLVVQRYRQQGRHCPLTTLLSELGRSDPEVAVVVTDLLERWRLRLAQGIRRLRDSGEVAPHLDPDRVAAAVLAGLQGGATALITTGDSTALESALDLSLDYLRASPPAAARPYRP
jgi:AcrR family transcriptional regulator